MDSTNCIILYSDEFDIEVWQRYCDICDVPYSADEIEIRFKDADVSYG